MKVTPGRILFFMCAVGLLVAGIAVTMNRSPGANTTPAPAISSTRPQLADLDLDGTVESVAIRSTSKSRREVAVSQALNGESRLVWRHAGLNPWKLQIADVDGDGRREIVLGVWKTSPKDPVMEKRVFVYTWDGRRMTPKWLGSRLARRFDDFAVADVNSDGWDELAALERMPGGAHRVSLYRWKSFGFDWLGCTDAVDGAASLDVSDHRILLRTRQGDCRIETRQGVRLAKLEDSG